MKKFILILSVAIILAGCNQDNKGNGISVTEVDNLKKDKGIQRYIDHIANENGFYFFSDGSDQFFVILNEMNPSSGGQVAVYDEVTAERSSNILKVNVEQHLVLLNEEPDARRLRIFKVKKKRSVDTDSIQLVVNGEDTPFDGASGR